MSLETGEFIADLSPTNPPNTDPVSQGAGHLRLLKKTIQQSFPNVTGEISFSPSQANKLASMAASAVLGRSAVTVGAPAEIVAASNNLFLRRIGDLIGFGKIDLADALNFLGVLGVLQGGTGAADPAGARANLGVPSFAEASLLWDQDANLAKIINLLSGTLPTDAATLLQAQTAWNKNAGNTKITNLSAGTLSNDAARFDQLGGEAIARTTAAGVVTNTGRRVLSCVKGNQGGYAYTLASGAAIRAVFVQPTEGASLMANLDGLPSGLSFTVAIWVAGNNPALTDASHYVWVV